MRITYSLLVCLLLRASLPMTAIAQFSIDLTIQGTTEATEETPGALVALNDDFDEDNQGKYIAPAALIPSSFVRPPSTLARSDNQEHDPTGLGGEVGIKADTNHSNRLGDDDELADAVIAITGPGGSTGKWSTNVTSTSGELKVWWHDGTKWVEVDSGLIVSTLTPVPAITLPTSGNVTIPLKIEGIQATDTANGIELEARFETSSDSVSDNARISVIDVQIQINLTADEVDDYVTWGPTRCRARVVGMGGRNNSDGSPANLEVVLRNAPQVDKWIGDRPVDSTAVEHRIRASPVPDDRGRYSGGRVRFSADSLPVGTTATHETHPETGSTTLPTDSSWHRFRIAGEFGRPSFFDRDTIIEAREATIDGRSFGSHRLMVRVRKNAHSMQSFEVQRFLEALAIAKDNHRWPSASGSTLFDDQERTHTFARRAGDEAHSSWRFWEGPGSLESSPGERQPSFLPWHRVFILQFERGLQKLPGPVWEPNRYQAVTLPYWEWDTGSNRLFKDWFIGAPDKPGTSWSAEDTDPARFHTRNPVRGWQVPGFSGGRLVRRNHAAIGSIGDNVVSFSTLTDLFAYSVFGRVGAANNWGNGFLINMEEGAHNPGHTWNCGAGQLRAENHSAKDPLFYLLHAQVDRQWAAWQNLFDAYLQDSQSYDISDGIRFPGASGNGFAYQRGSYLNDTMWPWDGTGGGSGRSARPPMVPGKFSPSGIPHIWPLTPSEPTPGDAIDYEGRSSPDESFGFAYDDVPFDRGTLAPLGGNAGVRLQIQFPGGVNQTVGTQFAVRITAVTADGHPVAAAFNGTVRLTLSSGTPGSSNGTDQGVFIAGAPSLPTVTLDDDQVTFSGPMQDFNVIAHTAETLHFRALQVDGGLPTESDAVIVSP